MNYKKITLVTFVLLAILTMGAVSASEDVAFDELAASDEVADVQLPQENLDDALSDGNSTDFFPEVDDGGDGDEEDPYHIEIVEEFDVSDQDQTIISIFCPEGTEGWFVIMVLDDDWREIFDYEYEITEDDYDATIQITPADLEMTEPGGYIIDIYLTDDPEEYHDVDLIYEDRRGIEAVDYTQFRYISLDTFNPNALSEDNIFAVYCPEGSEGDITVEVWEDMDGEPFISQKPVSEKDDENKLYWTLSDLELTEEGRYFINVLHDGDEIGSDEVEVANPIGIEPSSYINSTSPHGRLARIVIPSDITDAYVVLTIYGDELLNMSLSDFADEGGDSPYWEYSGGSDWIDENYKCYLIDNYHLDCLFEEGEYRVVVYLYLADGREFSADEDVRMIERCVATNGDYSIEIFGDSKYDFEEAELIASITVPEGSEGTVRIWADDSDFVSEFPLNELTGFDNGEYWIFSNSFEELGPGEWVICVAYNDENGDRIVDNSAYVKFICYDDDEEDGPIDEIEFHLNSDDEDEDDEISSFNINDDGVVAYLWVPDNEEFADTVVEVTVEKNGQNFAVFRTDEMEGDYDESREANKYPITLDLNELNDKDLLRFTWGYLGEMDMTEYAIQIDEDTATFHWYEEMVEWYVFYGNLTTGDLNNPELMGPHPNGDFIEFSIPDAYGVTDGSIVVSDGDTAIISKTFDDMEPGYNYHVLGNAYAITLDDYDYMDILPENQTLTVTLNYGSDSLTFKRIRVGDYVSKVLTPDDIAPLYDVEITGDELDEISPDVVSIVATDAANRQSILIDLGSGQFNVYVDGVKVENLGELLLHNWIYQSDILYADEETLEEMGIYEDTGYSPEEFAELDVDERAEILEGTYYDEFGSELYLFRMTSFHFGCPYVFITMTDLGIEESGTYNIKVKYVPAPYENDYEPEPGEPEYLDDDYIAHDEILVLERDVTVTLSERIQPDLSVAADDIYYGETANIVVSMNEAISDVVYVTVDEEAIYEVAVVNGRGTIALSGLKKGYHDVSVDYEGTEEIDGDYANTAFEVIGLDPSISAPAVTTQYGKDVNITVNLARDASGYVWFTINGKSEKAPINKGVATYTVSNLNYGLYDVGIKYNGNYKYAADTISTTLKVNKNSPIVSVVANDIGYGENATVTVNLAKNVPGNVQITIGNITKKAKITDGVATATFSGLKRGTYEVTASYNGNINYAAKTKTTTFMVVRGTPIISVDAPDAGFGEDAIITVNLRSDVPGNAWVTVNGATERVKITNGVATYAVSGLKRGTYDVTVHYNRSTNYNAQDFTTTLNVVKGTPIASISVDDVNVGGDALVTVNFANNVNGFVKITVNGVTERVQIVGGIATATFSNLKAGSYDVTVVYAGSTNFNGQTATASFSVNKISPGITIRKSTVDGSPKITVKIAQDAPGNVRIAVNGATYKLPISNGEASIILPELGSGSYLVEATYNGNYKYLAETKTQTISVR